jgi:N-dimethylarginine dimethylaminohydrolase
MTFSVHQHWDPLKVCVVGRSYPPEFYSWITVPHVRSLFEKIAIETEEDYQAIIKKLNEFGVKVLRPNLPTDILVTGNFQPPPMTPRDLFVMVGEKFYYPGQRWESFFKHVKDPSWPNLPFNQLPTHIQEECVNVHGWGQGELSYSMYSDILTYVKQQGNQLIPVDKSLKINGAMVSRIGKDLYFGTSTYNQNTTEFANLINSEFTNTRNHIVNTGGHSDGTFCPVCPGLIISLRDVPSYATTFPDWEVVYLPHQSWEKVAPFLNLKIKNKGKWWIPGFEYDQDVIDVVESWLGHWTGYVEETVFDVNMLVIDPKNVIVFNYNKQVFDALERYSITPHIVPFRHRYFWDGGIHCVTTDLHREGVQQDYFPQRG